MNLHITPQKKLIRYAGQCNYNAWSYGQGGRGIGPSGLGYKQEELLSYLTGLGPVGEPVEIERDIVVADLGLKGFHWYYVCLNELLKRRYVKRIACSHSRITTTGLLVVLKRLEDLPETKVTREAA